MRIAVLALQGAFIEHEKMLSALGVDYFEIRQQKDLEQDFDGLIIPGGESTVQGKLLKELNLFEPLKKRIEEGLFVYGTCAGLILLAKEIENDDRTHFATMDIKVVRNGYGRQLGSFSIEEEFKNVGKVRMTFIRAPYIASVGNGVEILAKIDGRVVAARQNNQLVTAFHPELNEDLSIHKFFVDMIKKSKM